MQKIKAIIQVAALASIAILIGLNAVADRALANFTTVGCGGGDAPKTPPVPSAAVRVLHAGATNHSVTAAFRALVVA